MKRLVFLISLLIAILLSSCGTPATPVMPPTATFPLGNVADLINPPQTPSACVEINVSNMTPKVGDVINVTATLKGVVKPTYWGLEVKDEGEDTSSMLINLLTNPLRAAAISHIIKMTTAERDETSATIKLEIIGAGSTDVNYFVSAEDFCGTPLGSGVSAKVKITASP